MTSLTDTSDSTTSSAQQPDATALSRATGPLLRAARVAHTPCGDGSIIWHIWGEKDCNPALAPVVLFHGGSGSWTHWLMNLPFLLASGRRLYVPDLPGFGDSAPPAQGGDADAMVEPLAAGMRQLLGDEPCDLIGFSFGGLTGGLLAAQHPSLLARLVLAGAPALAIAVVDEIRLRAWAHLPDESERIAAHRYNLATLMFHRPEAITELPLQLHMANVVRDRMRGRRLARTDILLRALTGMALPVFAIYGREDVLYRGQLDALQAALAQAPDFRGLKLIDNAGHWVQFEQPAAFDLALMGALDTPVD